MAREYIKVKDWMYVDRAQRMKHEFVAGVAVFMEFVRKNNKVISGKLLCPCDICGNKRYQIPGEVELHIVKHGFTRFYTIWLYHGEEEINDNVIDSDASTSGTPSVPVRLLSSEHSAVGGDQTGTSRAPVVFYGRNYRFSRAARRVQAHSPSIGGQLKMQSTRGTRGPNQAHRLKPDVARGQGPFSLFWTPTHRYTGPNAERFGRYMGDESRHYKKYPLHMDWGEQHNRSFELFWEQAQVDYAFLPFYPDESTDEKERVLDPRAIYRGLKTSMQEKVRYNRNKLKVDCYQLWRETPLEERDVLLRSHAFSGVDIETWPLLCKYFASDRKQKQAQQNKQNKKSLKRGRATYTGGSRNMIRATERVRAKVVSTGGTPSTLHDYLATHATSMDPSTGTYTYPDPATEAYCERVVQQASASGVDFTGKTDPTTMTPILDAVHGGHHGGYERGLGVGASRSHLKASSITAFFSPTPCKRHLETQVATLTAAVEELKDMMLRRTGRSGPASPSQVTVSASTSPATPASSVSSPPSIASISTPATAVDDLRGMGYSEEEVRRISEVFGRHGH